MLDAGAVWLTRVSGHAHLPHQQLVHKCSCTQQLSTSTGCPEGFVCPKTANVLSGHQGCCIPINGPGDAARIGTAGLGTYAQAHKKVMSYMTQVHDTLSLSNWMTSCCSSMLLRDLYLPGSHDSGTYMWTTPKHMPLVLDEILTIIFNIVGDLSRTQQVDVYRQLQLGARVLDLRLAINPWIAVQQRIAHESNIQQSKSSSVQPLLSRLLSLLAHTSPMLKVKVQQKVQDMVTQQTAFQWADAFHLEGKVNMEAFGGQLTAAERKHCIVTSHSLPAAPLVQVLADVRRFLSQNPGELVVLLVKADTIDVNVAGSVRFMAGDWAAAAEVFVQALQGVQLVDEQQVQQLTLGQLADNSRGRGSVLLYSLELQQQGLPAASSKQAHILESWGNGTNTEDVSRLQQQLVDWLLFWRSANWRHKRRPFLLLASAEVTLGVRSILTMVRDRLWHWQQAGNLQQAKHAAAAQQQSSLRAFLPWLLLRRHADLARQAHSIGWESQLFSPQPTAKQKMNQMPATSVQQQQQQQQNSLGILTAGPTTLYQLGLATNAQLMQQVLNNTQVPKAFNVWSMDAFSERVARFVVSLNSPVTQASVKWR